MRKVLTASAISMLALVFAASSVMAATIGGNGSNSHNKILSNNSTYSSVSQLNVSSIGNNVSVSSNTGGNKANKNTGGNVTLMSGVTTTTVGITNLAGSNSNTSTNSCCPCNIDGSSASITDNGAGSSNKIITGASCVTKVKQTNISNIYNGVHVGSNTGGNSANRNTGGDVNVISGDTNTNVTVNNAVGSNISM